MPPIGVQRTLTATSLCGEARFGCHTARSGVHRRVLQLHSLRPDREGPPGGRVQCVRGNPTATARTACPVRHFGDTFDQVHPEAHPTGQGAVGVHSPARCSLVRPRLACHRNPVTGFLSRHRSSVPQLDLRLGVRRHQVGDVASGPWAQGRWPLGQDRLGRVRQGSRRDGRSEQGGRRRAWQQAGSRATSLPSAPSTPDRWPTLGCSADASRECALLLSRPPIGTPGTGRHRRR